MHRHSITRRTFLGGTMVAAATLAHATGSRRAGRLRIAPFACDITPPLGTPVYSSYKPLESIEHPLLGKGVIIEHGDERYVLCAVDWCKLRNASHLDFRAKLAKAAQAPIEHVAVQAVHQHTAPNADAGAMQLVREAKDSPLDFDVRVYDEAAQRLAEAAAKALDTLTPFNRIGLGQAKVEQVGSSRRVPCGNGLVERRMSSCTIPRVRAMPEGEIDPWLKTITFADGDRALARIHYYATHPQSFYGDPRVTYDLVGMARERFEQEEGVFQVYFTGCAGDVACGKYNDGSKAARARLADQLFAGMKASVASTKAMRAPAPAWVSTKVVIPARTDPGYTLADWQAKLDDATVPTPARVGAAMNIMWLRRANEPFELGALHLGPVRILHLPGEPMVEFQLYAQRIAPRCFVAVAGVGDGPCGYLCTEKSFPEGGYEPGMSMGAPKTEWVLKEAIQALVSGA